uniref:Cytochrome P450 n=1 Tax=Tetranychus urticae TaxID=32264 RepID=T1KYD1_TETUR
MNGLINIPAIIIDILPTIFIDTTENFDRQRMPLTMAFSHMYVALRHSSIVPLNLLRRATEDTKVGGYSIPKDSLLFKPERFLNEDKSKAIKPPYLIAFSSGKRVCPGESFAYLQLFLYLVSFLQQLRYQLNQAVLWQSMNERQYTDSLDKTMLAFYVAAISVFTNLYFYLYRDYL